MAIIGALQPILSRRHWRALQWTDGRETKLAITMSSSMAQNIVGHLMYAAAAMLSAQPS
jgi:hypothetical protein